MTRPILLIGDIGGTNARFALADPLRPGFSQVSKIICENFESAELAIAHYLKEQALPGPDAICLAAAGPVVEGGIHLTNNHWCLNASSLSSRFGADRVELLNDFEAVAYSLPHLGPRDIQAIGTGSAPKLADTDFTVGVLGPGTGLGVAGLMGRSGAVFPVVGEGGHRGFAPATNRQIQLLKGLHEREERVINEHIVSGPGLERVFSVLNMLQGQPERHLSAAAVFALAEQAGDKVAEEAVQLLFEVLGQVAGDVVLEWGAWDGMFIAGGIVPRYKKLLECSDFRAAFERKGRYRSLLEQVPTLLITHPDPGLLGAAFCALNAHNDVSGAAT